MSNQSHGNSRTKSNRVSRKKSFEEREKSNIGISGQGDPNKSGTLCTNRIVCLSSFSSLYLTIFILFSIVSLRSSTPKESNENEANLHRARNKNDMSTSQKSMADYSVLTRYLSANDLELFADKLQNVREVSPERHKLFSKELDISNKEPKRAIDDTDLPNSENKLSRLDHHGTGNCSKHHGNSYC